MRKCILAFYNGLTNEPLCYVMTRWAVTSDVKKAFEYEEGLGLYKMSTEMIDGIYGGNDHGNMTEHEYFHIREDYFSGTKKSEVMPMIVTKDSEILYLRKRKIQKIYEKARIL